MSLTKNKGGQGTPGTARMGNMPALTETDGRGGVQEKADAEARITAGRPGPARRVSRAYADNRKLNGALNAQGIKDAL